MISVSARAGVTNASRPRCLGSGRLWRLPMTHATGIVVALVLALVMVTIASVHAWSEPSPVATLESGSGPFNPTEPVETPARDG